MVISADEAADTQLASLLHEGLVAANMPFLGAYDERGLTLAARCDGRVQGGLTAVTARGFLRVDMLYVIEAARGRGLGSCLLCRAEEEAVHRGCHGAWLDTYDFQARPFYERHGYMVFGTLTGFADGHERYYMVKRLRQG